MTFTDPKTQAIYEKELEKQRALRKLEREQREARKQRKLEREERKQAGGR